MSLFCALKLRAMLTLKAPTVILVQYLLDVDAAIIKLGKAGMGDKEVDQQLVERAQRGDKHAFELLVLKYQRRLGRLISRFVRDSAEVEDVTQEAFIKAYRALPSFRGDSAFYTWLYRIGINTAKNYLVSLGRRAPTTTLLSLLH